MTTYRLHLLPGRFAVCTFPPDTEIPEWPSGATFWSVVRTRDELTFVVSEENVLPGWQTEPGWRCLEVGGPLDFSITGVLSALTSALAEAEISVFAISTYSTDYLLVKEPAVDRAREVLSRNGHSVEDRVT